MSLPFQICSTLNASVHGATRAAEDKQDWLRIVQERDFKGGGDPQH